MPDNDVDVQIKISKTGAGAQQAADAIHQVKQAADQANLSTGHLNLKLGGFRTILHSVGQMAKGGATAVAGFGRALSGVVVVLSNTVWGRIAMILATVVGIAAALYQKFIAAKDAIDQTSQAAGNLRQKIPKDLGEPGLPNAIEFAKQLTAEFEKSSAAAERIRKSTDELSDAQLALKLAGIDREVAGGGMTAEQGQQARIEARLAHEQGKIAREKALAQDTISRGERAIAAVAEPAAGAAEGVRQTEAEIKSLGFVPGRPVTAAELAQGTRFGERRQALQANMLQKRLAEQQAVAAERLKAYDTTREKIAPEVETAKGRLSTLDVLATASSTTASAQSLEVSAAINKKKDEQEIQAAAQRAAFNARAQDEQARRAAHQKTLERAAGAERQKDASARAALAADLQQAQEQSARIQLSAAERAAGQKGLTPRETVERATAVQTARSAFARESAETAQAKALQAKVRETTDPAALQNLIRSIEALGVNVTAALNQAAAAVNQVNAQVNKQAGQLKNGGLRTQ